MADSAKPVHAESRVKIHAAAKRLVVREYVPMGSLLLTWSLLGLTIGHADLVRLIAANGFAQAARAFCTLETTPPLALRAHSEQGVRRDSLRTALRLDLIGLTATAAALAVLAFYLWARGMPHASAMAAIMILGVPARHPGLLLVSRRDREIWRIGASVIAMAGATAVYFLHLSWTAAAVVIASRDWGGLAATAIFAPLRAMKPDVPTEPLRFEEAAVQTEASARKRLGYRLLRTVFGLLGPWGNIAARTGRGLGKLDHKIARFIPHSRPGFILFTAVTFTAAIVLLSIGEPSTFLVAAALTNLAASGGAALMWWRHRDFSAEVQEEDDTD